MTSFAENHAKVNLDPVEELLRRRQLWATAPDENGNALTPDAAIVPIHTINRALAELIANRVEQGVKGAREQLARFHGN